MKALSGLRVVVTRAAHQAEELARPLRDRGAEAIVISVIDIAPPENPKPLREAVLSDAYQWIIFTSVNAVSAFVSELRTARGAVSARVATVGEATKKAAERYGMRVDLVPENYIAESLVEAFAAEDLDGARILIPSAAMTRDVVAPALRSYGARVDVVEAYRNVVPPQAAERVRTVFQAPYPDWVTFASSSAVTNLVNLVGKDCLSKVKIATIGPATSETVRRNELAVAAEASVHTSEGLVQAIANHPSDTVTAKS
jgi:uroporphyrinogen-III synthase